MKTNWKKVGTFAGWVFLAGAGLAIAAKAPQGESMRQEEGTLRRTLGLPFRPIGRTIGVFQEDDPTNKVKRGLGFAPAE